MSEECTHDCGSCGKDCSERDMDSMLAKPHRDASVKKVIAVISGKGGVGKSTVTGMLAVAAQKGGHRVGILDADITGPSIPKMFGIHSRAQMDETAVYPEVTPSGIQVMSINLLLENETDPVIWRGPIIAGTVTQFWTEVVWDDVDYLFVDMPPGTGDVPLTVFQSLPVDGIIVVTSPQELVGMVVKKAVNMAGAMGIPLLGIVENMSYFVCPNCKKKHYIFGQSNIEATASELGIKNFVRLPMDPGRAAVSDAGEAEQLDTNEISGFLDKVLHTVKG